MVHVDEPPVIQNNPHHPQIIIGKSSSTMLQETPQTDQFPIHDMAIVVVARPPLEACFQTVLACSQRFPRHEIVVVDCNDIDGSNQNVYNRPPHHHHRHHRHHQDGHKQTGRSYKLVRDRRDPYDDDDNNNDDVHSTSNSSVSSSTCASSSYSSTANYYRRSKFAPIESYATHHYWETTDKFVAVLKTCATLSNYTQILLVDTKVTVFPPDIGFNIKNAGDETTPCLRLVRQPDGRLSWQSIAPKMFVQKNKKNSNNNMNYDNKSIPHSSARSCHSTPWRRSMYIWDRAAFLTLYYYSHVVKAQKEQPARKVKAVTRWGDTVIRGYEI